MLPENPSHEKSLTIQHSRVTLTHTLWFASGRGHPRCNILCSARGSHRYAPSSGPAGHCGWKTSPCGIRWRSTSGQSTDRISAHPIALFWAWLSRVWSGRQDALAFVQPRTVVAWQRTRFRDHWARLSRGTTPGRPVIAKEIRALIRTMWQANPTWGAPRIVGELRKLGIEVAKSTVEKYRVQSRTLSSPTWKTFLKTHVRDLVPFQKGFAT